MADSGGPGFDASTPLETVLAWPDLPAVLRRALTRAMVQETRERLSFGDSVRAWTEPLMREWIVGLLALDIGVGFAGVDGREQLTSLIGVFSAGELGSKAIERFLIAGVHPGQGFGAGYRAPSPGGPATVCAAAYTYADENDRLESAFVFVAGATEQPVVQLELDKLDGRPFDAAHIDGALDAVAQQVDAAHAEAARAVVREALLECRAVTDNA